MLKATLGFDMGVYTEATEQAVRGNVQNRDSIELLRSRAGLLAGTDRVLTAMYLRHGMRFRLIAKLTGTSEVSIARRIHRLIRQLLGSEYFICLRNKDIFTCAEMEVAKDYFLLDLSIREIAIRRRTSRYHVSKTVKKITKLVAIIRQGNR